MKMNWGTGLSIAIAAFMLMIIFFVFGASKLQTELVADNYYEKEIKFQETIDKQKNANALNGRFKVTSSGRTLTVTLPNDLEGKAISGKISLYRPSDSNLDFEVEVIDDLKQVIESKNLIPGKWKITIDFTADGKGYHYEKEMYI